MSFYFAALLDSKLNPLKKNFTLFLLGVTLFSACQKEKNFLSEKIESAKAEACEVQTKNPSGRSYSGHSVSPFIYSKKNCGLLPLSTKNYWVYQDSVYIDGVFNKVQYDTLRFGTTWKTLSDSLIWWGSNINIGIPEILYATDSAFFTLQTRLFNGPTIKDAKKDFSLFPGDSLLYLASFGDIAAQGRSLKLKTTLKTSVGSFSNCVYFEKNARGYRKDQVILKPGLGVLKYIHEEAPMGQRVLKLQQVLTLVAFHIE